MDKGSDSPEFMGTDGFIWWYGLVEDIDDKLKLGRVKVRVWGFHSLSKEELSTEQLPWAQTILPTTSATSKGVGHSPTGIQEGSWVLGFFSDGRRGQFPVVLGTVPMVHRYANIGPPGSSGGGGGGSGRTAGPGGGTKTPQTGGGNIDNPKYIDSNTGNQHVGDGSVNSGGMLAGAEDYRSYPGLDGGSNYRLSRNSSNFSQNPKAIIVHDYGYPNGKASFNSAYRQNQKTGFGYHIHIAKTPNGPVVRQTASFNTRVNGATFEGTGRLTGRARELGLSNGNVIHMSIQDPSDPASRALLKGTIADVGRAKNIPHQNVFNHGEVQTNRNHDESGNVGNLVRNENINRGGWEQRDYNASNFDPQFLQSEPVDPNAQQETPLPEYDPSDPYPDGLDENNEYADKDFTKQYANTEHSTHAIARGDEKESPDGITTGPSDLEEPLSQDESVEEQSEAEQRTEPFLPKKEEVIENTQDSKRTNKWEQAATPMTVEEPKSPAVGKYPKVDTVVGPSGSRVEVDHTKGAERMMVYHPTGTYIEIDSAGNVTRKAKGNVVDIAENMVAVRVVEGEYSVSAEGAVRIYSKGDVNVQAATGSVNIESNKDINLMGTGDLTIKTQGALNLSGSSIGLHAKDGAIDLQSADEMNFDTNGEMNINAGSTLNMETKEGLNFRSNGGAVMIQSAGGAMNLESKGDTNIHAKGDLNQQGDGATNIKAAGGNLNLDGGSDIRMNEGNANDKPKNKIDPHYKDVSKKNEQMGRDRGSGAKGKEGSTNTTEPTKSIAKETNLPKYNGKLEQKHTKVRSGVHRPSPSPSDVRSSANEGVGGSSSQPRSPNVRKVRSLNVDRQGNVTPRDGGVNTFQYRAKDVLERFNQ